MSYKIKLLLFSWILVSAMFDPWFLRNLERCWSVQWKERGTMGIFNSWVNWFSPNKETTDTLLKTPHWEGGGYESSLSCK